VGDDVDKAIAALNGSQFGGRTLNVNEARPKPQHFIPSTPRTLGRVTAHNQCTRDDQKDRNASRSGPSQF
jgi:RNA recognition motif-containing protein